jgi:hypothetical protein
MKRILLLASITLFSIASASAQCTPDPQYTTPGIYPDSATGLSAGCVGDPYDQLITNVVPVDTAVQLVPPPIPPVVLPFDSVVIISVTGLPAGFTYACNDVQNTISPADGCAFEGGTSGCVSISGTPAAGDEGVYPLLIVVEAFLGGQPTAISTINVDWYSIEILPAGNCNAGLSILKNDGLSLYPNPAENVLTLNGISATTERISITSANGQLMNTYTNITGSSMELNVQHLENGIYFIRIQSDEAAEAIRFVKK